MSGPSGNYCLSLGITTVPDNGWRVRGQPRNLPGDELPLNLILSEVQRHTIGPARSLKKVSSRSGSTAVDRRRRRRSIALWHAVVVSYAPGFCGTPSRGQCPIAATKASCNAYSASSKSPSQLMRVAMSWPYFAAHSIASSRFLHSTR